jgi:lipoyl(octanoyl) transferase
MIHVVQLGSVDYATALRFQQTLVELRKAGRIGDVLLLLEHPPVITLGRNAKSHNVLASPAQLAARGVSRFECDRGGDVTFHGPGQLVGYPIFDLRSLPAEPGSRDSHKTLGAVQFVRRIEEALIRTCADFGIAAARAPGLTGVWTERSQSSPDPPAKIAAIGVHISRGVTSHGFALNVNTELSFFQLIIPCGITSKPVTSLAKELGQAVPVEQVAESAARNFGRVFSSQVLWLETLDQLTGTTVGVPMRPPAELRALHEDEQFWG